MENLRPQKFNEQRKSFDKFFIEQEYQLKHNKLPCNYMTVSHKKAPEYYMKLVRYHLKNNADTITLQALGHSTPHLIQLACLVQIKNYGVLKRIKNDHLIVPIADQSGAHVGMIKRVRLTVKIEKSKAFGEIIEKEHQKILQVHSPNRQIIEPKKAEEVKACFSDNEEQFDKEDLKLQPADFMDQLLQDIPIREEEDFNFEFDPDISDLKETEEDQEGEEDEKFEMCDSDKDQKENLLNM